MKLAGTAGSEDRKKFFAVCVFSVAAVLVLYFELRDPSTSAAPPPPPPVITSAPAQGTTSRPGPAASARKVGTTDAALDPTLHAGPMLATESLAYQGTGRNIFTAAPAEIVIPRPIQPARPLPVAPTQPINTGPPPPPPIDLRFSGYLMSPGSTDRQAILVHGDDVVLAREGDVVLRRYKVVSISANSIQVEDLSNNNRQVLPLITN